jgi:hypothetical protein
MLGDRGLPTPWELWLLRLGCADQGAFIVSSRNQFSEESTTRLPSTRVAWTRVNHTVSIVVLHRAAPSGGRIASNGKVLVLPQELSWGERADQIFEEFFLPCAPAVSHRERRYTCNPSRREDAPYRTFPPNSRNNWNTHLTGATDCRRFTAAGALVPT